MRKSRQSIEEGDAPLEALRVKFTDLKQDEFIVKCGFRRATYQRWASGKTVCRLTPEQIVAVCKTCKVSYETFFEHFLPGNIPKDSPPEKNALEKGKIQDYNAVKRIYAEEGIFLKALRKGLKMTQAQLAVALDVDPSTIGRCERGMSEIALTIRQTKKLCQLAGKTLDDLPGYLGKPPEPDEQ